MRVAQRAQAAGSQGQGLVPARLAEHRPPVTGPIQRLPVLGRARLADQRHRQALGMVGIVETEPALDAQPTLVGRAVAAVHSDDALVLDLVGHLAAHAAERADRGDLAIHLMRADQGLGHQRAGGTGLHAFAAGHAAAGAHGIAQVEHHLRRMAALRHADHVVGLLLAAGAHAARALDAGV